MTNHIRDRASSYLYLSYHLTQDLLHVFTPPVRPAPLASFGLVAHFPSCSPVVVVVVVRTFTGAKTKLSHQQNYLTSAGQLAPYLPCQL